MLIHHARAMAETGSYEFMSGHLSRYKRAGVCEMEVYLPVNT